MPLTHSLQKLKHQRMGLLQRNRWICACLPANKEWEGRDILYPPLVIYQLVWWHRCYPPECCGPGECSKQAVHVANIYAMGVKLNWVWYLPNEIL